MGKLPNLIAGAPGQRPLWFLRDLLADERNFLFESLVEQFGSLQDPARHENELDAYMEIDAILSDESAKVSLESMKAASLRISQAAESYDDIERQSIDEKVEYIKTICDVLTLISENDVDGVLAFLREEIAAKSTEAKHREEIDARLPTLGRHERSAADIERNAFFYRGDAELLTLIMKLIEAGR